MKSLHVYSSFTLIALIFSQGCALKQTVTKASLAPQIEIPVEIVNGLPTVDATIRGRPIRLFLDLGGHNEIALTTEDLKKVEVDFSADTVRYQDSTGKEIQSRKFIAPDVVLGGVKLGQLQGTEFIFGNTSTPDKNGYIGMGFLEKYFIVLDYPEHRVRLYRTGDKEAFENECGRNTFTITKKNGIVQSIAITDIGDLVFLWDTGSTHNVIRTTVIESAKQNAIVKDNGPPIFKMKSIRFLKKNYGPTEFRSVPFRAPQVDGVLGTPFFSTRRVCLDIGAHKGAIKEG